MGFASGGRYGDVGYTWNKEYGCVGYGVVHRDGGHESLGHERVEGLELWGVLVIGLGGGHGGVGSVGYRAEYVVDGWKGVRELEGGS